jgi:toluene monooxygenase electron transfer component
MHFEVDLSEPMDFQAGQFVTLKAPGIIGRRAYSMVNYSPSARRLTFVVKRKPGGGFSDWLFDGDVTGCQLDIAGPLGKATFRPEEDRNIVCIAGGSGIAGMISMVEHAVSANYFDTRHGYIFFGVRSLADAFYIERLAQNAAVAGPNLKVVLALSHEDISNPNHRDFPDIALAKGFVHEVASARMAGQWDNAAGFVAGPEPMVNAALKVLIAEAGLPPAFIRYDKFS